MKTKVNVFSVVFYVLFICSCSSKHEIKSPNGKIKISVSLEKPEFSDFGTPHLNIEYEDDGIKKEIFSTVKLGLETNARVFSGNLKLVAVSSPTNINDDYRMITGKRSHCTNQATEKTYTFENDKGQKMDVVFRVYNDGVVFRYEIETQTEKEVITDEYTIFPIPEGVKRWAQEYNQDYEGFYPLAVNGNPARKKKHNHNHWGYPLLLEPEDGIFTLITEANIMRNHCGSRLSNIDNTEEYKVHLADENYAITGSWVSPWRVLIIGSLSDIVESTLVTDVSEPNKLKNTGWIKPGPTAWIYWANNHSSNDFQKVTEYIDLASEMNWPYNLIDWKWDGMDNGGNIEDALNYSRNKNVKPMLWYNSSTAWTGPGPLYRLNERENRIKEYEWLKEQGVYGLKIDFFDGDYSKTMNYYIDLLEDAADYELMLNFHGSTIPRGWQRTYPHLMTVEAVYGAEWYNNNAELTNKAAVHNTTLPYTRNVIGSMDYTPGTFTDSQNRHITSHGHELALYIAFESALQHMPDRPDAYLSLPGPIKDFLSKLPASWDDTKLLGGYPGEDVIIARRKGDIWYVAGLNGTDEGKVLHFTPDALPLSEKTITLFKDGEEERSFAIEENKPIADVKEKIEISCLPRGGFVAMIK